MSPLPFGIDGFALTRIASDIVSRGQWQVEEATINSYNTKLPGFSLFWAAVSTVAGLTPLLHAQMVVPILTSFAVLPAYLLGARATGRRIGGFASGLFIGLFGSFLNVTSSISKEALALVVLPMIVLLFAERADPRKRGLAVLLLVFLSFLHPLTTLLTLGMLASLVVLRHRRAAARGRFSPRSLGLDIVTGPGLALFAWAYYAAVDLPFLSNLLAPDAFALFLGWVLLLTSVLVALARPATLRVGRRLVTPIARSVVPPTIGAAAILVNGGAAVFAGTAPTQPAFLRILPGIFVLAAFAVAGYQLVRRTTNRANDLVVSMLIAPVALILFGFSRGLDPVNHVIVYRSFDFMDYAFAILVGVSFAAAWKGLRRWRPARAVLAAGFLGALLATTPMAWETGAVFGVENVTTSEEFQALAFVQRLGARNLTTDERLANVGAMWYRLSTDSSLPLRLDANESIAGFEYALVLERWTTVGAQIHPAPNVVIRQDSLHGFLAAHRVVYVAGTPGDLVFVVRLVP